MPSPHPLGGPRRQGVLPAPLSMPCAPQHLLKCSFDVVKRWVNEAQEAASSDNIMVQVSRERGRDAENAQALASRMHFHHGGPGGPWLKQSLTLFSWWGGLGVWGKESRAPLAGDLAYRLDGLMLNYLMVLITSKYCFGCAMPSAWFLVMVQWEPLPRPAAPPCGHLFPLPPHVLVLSLVSRARSGPSNPPGSQRLLPT